MVCSPWAFIGQEYTTAGFPLFSQIGFKANRAFPWMVKFWLNLVLDKNNNWVSCWYDGNKKLQRKYFSVKKYGDDQAKQMAVTLRKQMAEANGYINVWDSIKLKYIYKKIFWFMRLN